MNFVVAKISFVDFLLEVVEITMNGGGHSDGTFVLIQPSVRAWLKFLANVCWLGELCKKLVSNQYGSTRRGQMYSCFNHLSDSLHIVRINTKTDTAQASGEILPSSWPERTSWHCIVTCVISIYLWAGLGLFFQTAKVMKSIITSPCCCVWDRN